MNCQKNQTHPLTFSSKLTWIWAKQDWFECQSNELNRRGAIRNSSVWNISSSLWRSIMVLQLSIKSSHLASNDFGGGNHFTFSQKCGEKNSISNYFTHYFLIACLLNFIFCHWSFQKKWLLTPATGTVKKKSAVTENVWDKVCHLEKHLGLIPTQTMEK